MKQQHNLSFCTVHTVQYSTGIIMYMIQWYDTTKHLYNVDSVVKKPTSV